ncbi:hypothetical protein [uncultured Enterococcus sp.]|uniref:hypothetical protein n=1 Tax=uncultured Enterococcus sp. TaxID=167972 RepID=UPI002AA94775|nr:hypothetical protein [uncultured Enterococcus sp.]
MSSRYSEAQKQAATIYFISKGGVILEEEEKESGNYVYQVQIGGSNRRFKIDNDHLYWWEHRSGHWNWRLIKEAQLPRFRGDKSRIDTIRKELFARMEET